MSLFLFVPARQFVGNVLKGERMIGMPLSNCSVAFVDVVGFTQMARDMRARVLVAFLGYTFFVMDEAPRSRSPL